MASFTNDQLSRSNEKILERPMEETKNSSLSCQLITNLLHNLMINAIVLSINILHKRQTTVEIRFQGDPIA